MLTRMCKGHTRVKIYISASFTAQRRLRSLRDDLWNKGHDVVSTWLDEQVMPAGMDQGTFFRKVGVKDVAEVASCDMLIYDGTEPSTSGGRDVELGIALGRFQHCQIWTVAVTKDNPFNLLADRRFATWEELLEAIPHA